MCCSYFGLSGGRLCPTLVFAGGCVAAIAGLALTVVGAVGGSQSGFGSSAAYLVLLVVGLVLVGAPPSHLFPFLRASAQYSTLCTCLCLRRSGHGDVYREFPLDRL